MIDQWFKQDIDDVLKEHTRIVVTDKGGNGKFLVDNLHNYNVLKAGDELEELHARYTAEKEYADKPVVFYATIGKDKLRYLLEYAKTGGIIQLDNLAQYVTDKIWQHLKINPKVDGATLVSAARLSSYKDEKWWQKIAEGLEDPFDALGNVTLFLSNPTVYKEKGIDVWNLLVDKICSWTGLTYSGQSPETLASELMKTIFDRLADNSVNTELWNVYQTISNLSDTRNVMQEAIAEYKLPKDADFRKANPDHCFVKLDEDMVRSLANDITDSHPVKEYIDYIRARLKSKVAIDYKSKWLKDVETLLTFSPSGIKSLSSLDECAKYYRDKFCPLDAAMRHIYVAWLNSTETLRPLQFLYEQYEKELLDKWFSFINQYKPNQFGFLEEKLRQPGRVAIIVGDGLRLSLAETVRHRLAKSKINVDNNYLYTVLPSVTENGMSALYSVEPQTADAQKRIQHLQEIVDNVVVMDYDALNDSVTAQKLILRFPDIDQLGEKKQLGALKDIDGYEKSLADKIQQLIQIGFNHVYVTTDHGFVLTGILDEADKQPVPSQPVKKVEERFILADEPVNDNKLIERQDMFFGFKYQYYAKTDRPFITKGQYGYSHGGFTPQECIIPAYDFHTDGADNQLKVSIANKKDLADITGDTFIVKLKAEGDASSLFASSRKVKIVVYSGGKPTQKSPTITAVADKEIAPLEFDIENNDKVVIIDAGTKAQLDYAPLKKSDARDLGGLL